MGDMRDARRVMVDNQIRTFDVTDRGVLAAFDAVRRELFVGPADRAIAYSDRPLVVEAGEARRPLLMPLVLARLIQALQPEPGESALDVMGGTGYSAAILAAIGLDTTALERDPAFAEAARAALAAAGAAVTVLPAVPGLSAETGAALATGLFDIILINGASEKVPSGFFPLLKDGGRLGIILQDGGAQRVMVFVKSAGHASPRRAFDAAAPVLPGFASEPGFVF
jgi:protein-L-isoaspartate(D-aspartate) O-methyltransferase